MPLPVRLRPRAFAPLAAVLAACVLAPAARAQQPAAAPAPRRIPALYPGQFVRPAAVGADTSGLRFRVDEMRPDAGSPARPPVTDARPLTPAEAQRVFARLRPLRAAEADADSFHFPAETLPPPRAGRVLAEGFTARLADGGPARPVARAAAALEVVRRAPEGPVDEEAAEVTVTFSQPMVPLASLGAVRAQAVPVRLTPRPAGEWRWLDTRTLRFEPRAALPAATEYRVEVAAGTRSAAGVPLAGPVAWTFSTRAPQATGAWPQGQPTGFTPVLLVAFDQRVDPAAVLASIHLRAGSGAVPLRLATAAEVAADTQAARFSAGLPAGQWVAFRPVAALPGDADVRVSVGPGTPSAEGPRTTEVEQDWEFRTHGSFRVLRPECDSCRARQPVALYFSNPIDPRSFRAEGVRVEPAIAGMEAWVSENLLIISGDTRANTRYAVRLDPGLRDVFGQALDSAGPVPVNVVLPFAAVGAPRGVVVLDPAGARTVTVMTVAHARVRLRVMRVRPEDWFAFEDLGWSGRRPATLPGTAAVDREVAIDASDGDPHPLDVDLSPALAGGLGQALVAVEALDGADEWERRQAAYVWVQATRIGLGAFAEAAGLTAWATSLVDGAPLAGARVELIGRDTVDAARTRVQGSAVADARGVAALALLPGGTREQRLLVARTGGDVAILTPAMVQRWAGEWLRNPDPPTRVWHGFTDRTLYRPGETVHFKGWLRTIADVRDGGPELPRVGPADSVAWTAFDGEGNEIARGRAPLTALGGFDGAFTVPGGADLGEAYVALRLAPRRARANAADSAAAAEDDEGPEDDDYSARIEYRIDEFRRPEYTVAATASDGVHFVGGTVEVSARATYFAGGALPGAPVAWDVTASPASFVPPGWEAWSFGDRAGGSRTVTLPSATDARGSSAVRIALQRADPPVPYVVEASATVTDVNRQTWSSRADVLVHPASVYVGLRALRPWVARGDSIHLEMAAVDLDGRAVAGRRLVVGAVARAWREQDGRWTEEVVDSSAAACVRVSAPQPVRCAFHAARSGWYQLTAATTDERGRPTRSATRVWVMGGGTFAPPGPENEARRVDLVPDKTSYAVGDTARILLRTRFFPSTGLVTVRRNGIVRTQRIRVAESTATFAVPIGEADVPNSWIGVDLVGDGAGGEGARGVDHASGEVSLSVPPATRVLTVRALPRDSVSAPDARTAVELRVRDARGRPVAGAEVALAVVDEAVLALAGYRPPNPLEAFYRQRNAGVRTVDLRTLVQVYAPDFAPAAGTLVGRVTDAATGGPLGGATVTVKGTSLLARTDDAGRFRIAGVAPGRYTVDVQMSGFEEARLPVMVGDAPPPPVRVALVSSDGMRIRIRGANSQPLSLQSIVTNAVALEGVLVAKAPGVEIGSSRAPIAVRANFDPLAVFTPAVRTDREGRAVVPFTLPSNLTRYRVIAVAVHGGTLYGVGQAAITARQPLMVRPSAPRFLNWGDRFELPVVLQNQTGAPVQADVAVRADGIEMLDAGRRVTVPAHDRVEVRLRASAARVGEATLQVAAASPGGPADAAEVTIPVYTPATAESFATYGTFTGDSTLALPLQVPDDAIPGFGGLEVSASSTALQELTDALLYLVTYPYECSEQVASRLLGVTALRDVLSGFGARALPAPEALRASVQRDVRLLTGRQSAVGATGLWEEGDADFPYVSIHAAHALQRAREKGYDVPADATRRALVYLRAVPGNLPAWYPPDVRRALHAYALYVRARMDDSTAAGAVRAFMADTPRDSVTVEVAGWLLSAAARDPQLADEREELLRIVNNAATETASTATFATRYTDGEYLLLHSARRTDGVVLEGLLAAQPANPLVPKVVRGLLGHRVRGRWENTQENGWVLVALDRYFRAFEGQTPDFVARVWLGDRYAGGHRFAGRQADRWQLPVPMRVLQERRPDALTIGKEGEGRVYIRAGLRYAPRALELPPLEAGFAVSRRYDAVDDPADVRQDSAGGWHVRAGARVRVTLTLTAPSRRLHVALVDPLPAGFEAVNAELQGARPVPPGPADARSGDWDWWWRHYWYEHQNLRDQRAEAFTSLLRAGTYTWSYLARATTPGTFVAPPPHAEEMYSPETFGRGASDRVMVEAPDR
jgi:uncharacterized protein YfaS (alpha-2-macroglobulin family)